jgi:hypothetical protein
MDFCFPSKRDRNYFQLLLPGRIQGRRPGINGLAAASIVCNGVADGRIFPENKPVRASVTAGGTAKWVGGHSHGAVFEGLLRVERGRSSTGKILKKFKIPLDKPPSHCYKEERIFEAVVFGGRTLDLKGKQVMKAKILAVAVAASFLTGLTTARANVTGITYASGNSAALNCPYYYWPGGTSVNVVGTQYYGPGSINFNVTTDSTGDPTLTLGNNVVNDTGFAWTGYEVTVTMGQTFTLSSALVTVPPDWTVSSIMQPGAPVLGVYTGNIFLSAGTPVQVNQNLDFSYQLSFNGSVQFTETLTPTPEPATCTLLLGGLALGGWIARRRRS